MINDSHCHFFSPHFFEVLAKQRAAIRQVPDNGPSELYRELQWDDPETIDALADRWVREMDAHGVRRAALIASVPGDEASVAAAAARHPARIVAFFMLDPAAADAPARASRALKHANVKAICLFPAMHHVPLDDERTRQIVQAAADTPGTVVFTHCGRLSVGVREKLGLPSRFDFALGNPVAVSRLAASFPSVPFIVPHFGAGRLEEALDAVRRCANVHLDTSSSNNWITEIPGLTLRAVFESALAAAGPTRLLFGTDSSFFPRGWQHGVYDQQKAIVEEIGLNAHDRELIFEGNFDRLFPMSSS